MPWMGLTRVAVLTGALRILVNQAGVTWSSVMGRGSGELRTPLADDGAVANAMVRILFCLARCNRGGGLLVGDCGMWIGFGSGLGMDILRDFLHAEKERAETGNGRG